jgi:hypothetical protein
LATVGIFIAPAVLAAAALLSAMSWVVIAREPVTLCLGAPAPADVRTVGEGAIDGERTWMPVGERCTWATATGGTVTGTHYELVPNVGLWGGFAGMLASVAFFAICAKAGDDDSPVGLRLARQPELRDGR